MAVRLINLHRRHLHVDLRGGEVLVLAPGQRSDALREELLYDNVHLGTWERAGWVAREPASMQDVSAAEVRAAAARVNVSNAAPPAEAPADKPARKAAANAAAKQKA